MTEQQHPYPAEDQLVVASAGPATTETTEQPGFFRAKRWLAGAMLVTVGVAAGGGAAYALTTTPSPSSDVPGVGSGYRPDGFGRGPIGGAPSEGAVPGEAAVPGQPGQADQGQAEQGTMTQGTGADGEST